MAEELPAWENGWLAYQELREQGRRVTPLTPEWSMAVSLPSRFRMFRRAGYFASLGAQMGADHPISNRGELIAAAEAYEDRVGEIPIADPEIVARLAAIEEKTPQLLAES